MHPSVKRAAQCAGFTLIEVLVALTILAIALTATVRATSIATDGATEVRERILGTWVAQNQLAEYHALRLFPDVGDRSGDADQGGLRFRWTQTVAGTPNPFFRRVEIKVYSPRGRDYVIARVVGYATRNR